MTETTEPSAGANHSDDCLPVTNPSPEASITVELPGDVIAAIQHCTQQSGQTETETILAVLRAALGLKATQAPTLEQPAEQLAIDPSLPIASPDLTPSGLTPSNPALSPDPSLDASSPVAQWLQEFENLKNRLAALEHLLPKMEALEGKLLAF